MVGTYLHNGCKDRDYFLHFKKRTNLQKGSKVRDQNAYLLKINERTFAILDLFLFLWNN